MCCRSVLFYLCAFPRRAGILTLFSFVIGALILTNFLYLRRKTPENLLASLKDDHLIEAPQHDYTKWECERRLSTSAETHFEAALRNLTDLLPDEVDVEQLLSPLDRTEGDNNATRSGGQDQGIQRPIRSVGSSSHRPHGINRRDHHPTEHR